jgi:DNA-damage-inducible protein J
MRLSQVGLLKPLLRLLRIITQTRFVRTQWEFFQKSVIKLINTDNRLFGETGLDTWSRCDYNRALQISFREDGMTADTYVRARIDTATKERASDALEAMGLSVSDAIRLLMLRIAEERRLPFDVKVPNATTRKAIAELESGKGRRFSNVDALMADLDADD